VTAYAWTRDEWRPWDEQLQRRIQRYGGPGGWYAKVFAGLPWLVVRAQDEDSPDLCRRARHLLLYVAKVEVSEYLNDNASGFDATTINKYFPPMVYAAYCGLLWATERMDPDISADGCVCDRGREHAGHDEGGGANRETAGAQCHSA
jgi:hypothetical protein